MAQGESQGRAIAKCYAKFSSPHKPHSCPPSLSYEDETGTVSNIREKINACSIQITFPWEGWSHQEAAEWTGTSPPAAQCSCLLHTFCRETMEHKSETNIKSSLQLYLIASSSHAMSTSRTAETPPLLKKKIISCLQKKPSISISLKGYPLNICFGSIIFCDLK